MSFGMEFCPRQDYHFWTFRLFPRFFPRKTQNVMISLLCNRIFRELFVNGKRLASHSFSRILTNRQFSFCWKNRGIKLNIGITFPHFVEGFKYITSDLICTMASVNYNHKDAFEDFLDIVST